MSKIEYFNELATGRKLITVKYPIQEDNSDWEYVIVKKEDVKKVEEDIKKGNIKDMKTILYNTKQMILDAKEKNAN